MAPIIFVIGHAQHGKTTFRRALTEELGVRGASCSDTVYAVWAAVSGKDEASLKAIPKAEARPTLVALGNWLTTPARSYTEFFPFEIVPEGKPERLGKMGYPLPACGFLAWFAVCGGVRVLDGIRRQSELDDVELRLRDAGTPLLVVYVDNPRRHVEAGDNFSIPPSRAHKIVLNIGSEQDLRDKAKHFASEIMQES